MHIRDGRLAVMQSDNVILRAQIAEITDVPGSQRQRLFLFRELNFGLVTYYALARKGQPRAPATSGTRAVGNPVA
jgi:hypothetical protein